LANADTAKTKGKAKEEQVHVFSDISTEHLKSLAKEREREREGVKR
jgi:hypothetical protein